MNLDASNPKNKRSNKPFNLAIIGGGLAGKLCAIALAKNGYQIKLFTGSKGAPKDGRSTALLQPSLEFLDELDLLDQLSRFGEDLNVMRIIDGGDRLIRSKMIEFVAQEHDLPRFGRNFLNADLHGVFDEAISQQALIDKIEQKVVGLEDEGSNVCIISQDGSKHSFDLAVAADGKNSMLREMLSIESDIHHYPQSAVVFNIEHRLAHNQTSTEFHTQYGPFTLVPMSSDENRHMSSVVWVLPPDQAEALVELEHDVLALKVEERMEYLLGAVKLTTPAQHFPLSRQMARQYYTNKVFLIGETAHAMPPIGAQGFNLTIRDVVDLLDAIMGLDSLECGALDRISSEYQENRSQDARRVVKGVDLFNRSLLTSFFPAQIARYFAVSALNSAPSLKKNIVKIGLGN